MNSRSRRSTARASCPSAPAPRAACVPLYASRRKANLTWLSSLRTSAPEAMCRCAALAVGGDDRMQLAFNIGELHECGGAEGGEQIRQLGLARGATCTLHTGRLPRSFAGLAFKVGLTGQQRARVVPAGGAGGDVLRQPPQFGQLRGQDLVGWRASGQRPEAVGPVAFHPLPDATGPAGLQGQAQPLPGRVARVRGDVGLELGGGQVGLLVVDDGQRAAHGGHGPTAVSSRQAGDALCFPGRQPPGRRSSPPARPGPVELGGARAEIAGGQPQPPGDGVSHDRPGRPGPSRPAAPPPPWPGRPGGHGRLPGPDRPGRWPPRPATANHACFCCSKSVGRFFGGRPGGRRVSVQERDVSQQDEPFGQILLVATLPELVDGLLGDLAAVPEQAGRHQRAGAAAGPGRPGRHRPPGSAGRPLRRAPGPPAGRPFRAAADPRLWQ